VRVPVPLGYLTTLTKGDHVTIHEKSGRVLELIVTEVIVNIRPGLKYDLPGVYTSDIKGGISRLFADRSPLITFEQNGNNIIGISDYYEDNEIIGTRKGDTIKFKFRAVYGPVTGVWQVNSDGTKLDGTWNLPSITGGTWNLNRIYYMSELPDIAASLIKGKLVSDRSPVEVMLGDINSIGINNTIVAPRRPFSWYMAL